MLAYLSDTIYQVYSQPLFLLYLSLFWSVCILCFFYDVKSFIDHSTYNLKYTRSDIVLLDSRNLFPDSKSWRIYSSRITGDYESGIDWILYLYATGRALYIQFLVLAPMIWIITPYYLPAGEGFFTLSGWINFSSIKKLVYCTLIEEVLFYYGHRFLHQPSMWKYHRLHHELVTPVAVAAIYASIVENILVNFLPVFLSPLIVGLQMNLIWYWTILSTLTSVLSHSGFKKLEPFAKFHAIHHLTKGYNFGTTSLLDRLHGTYREDP